ncbi:MAG: hypothetical protein VZQ83_02910 [Eubacterium sp.]|nr:hypothetical protein [Eubacterium sp.]
MKRIRFAVSLFLLLAIACSIEIQPVRAAEKIYRTEVVYDPISIPAELAKDAPVYKADLTTRKKISDKEVTIKAGTAVTIINEKNPEQKKWFRLSFAVNNKTYTGYVKYSYVSLKNTEEITAKIIETPTTRKLRIKPEESAKVKSGSAYATVTDGNAVSVVSEVSVGTALWYEISYTFNKKKVTGFIKPKYVKFKKKKRTVKIYPLTEAEFEEEMTKQGVPDEYKQYLRALHEQYPFWEFRMYNTGLKWKTVIKNESKIGRSLISNSKSAAWKSKDPKAYDEKTGKWKVFDGSVWVAASQEAVAYYMDPRNFLNDRTIFQFELQEYQKAYHKAAVVEKILNNTPFASKSFSYTDPLAGKSAKMTYSNAFITAAENTNVSPLHLSSRVKQEVVTSATTTSGAVTGKNKNYPGIYNFYNIGAYSGKNPMENGLKWASSGSDYLRPWTDPYRSIVGGAMYIGTGYINKGQNTVYLEKFNVTENNRYEHQYMTNVDAASSEAAKIKKGYAESGLLEKTPLVFSIPVYKDMPAEPCAAPV